ncbi:GNAT family N-acetyltransferase [Undibacterium fentianense]|uniref:GNAT family N-acetyltransferase n=1 Tax=Undibacterium fentianense TaxID=2828728 RepID=A0A941E408_9BURK|nr:GNAT family N-acetyltransferase [Undibacterium fentianense]MBR7800712.1 GNAT family N-acetyltransferase [Undibacterium fentianense]
MIFWHPFDWRHGSSKIAIRMPIDFLLRRDPPSDDRHPNLDLVRLVLEQKLIVKFVVHWMLGECVFELPPLLSARKAIESDAGIVYQLFRDSRPDLMDLPLPMERKEQLIELQFLARQQGIVQTYPEAQIWIVAERGQDMASLVLAFEHQTIRLIDITLLSTARLRGLGTQMIMALQRHAEQTNASLHLAVVRGNTVAFRVYQKCGFVIDDDDGFVLQMSYRTPNTMESQVSL